MGRKQGGHLLSLYIMTADLMHDLGTRPDPQRPNSRLVLEPPSPQNGTDARGPLQCPQTEGRKGTLGLQTEFSPQLWKRSWPGVNRPHFVTLAWTKIDRTCPDNHSPCRHMMCLSCIIMYIEQSQIQLHYSGEIGIISLHDAVMLADCGRSTTFPCATNIIMPDHY